MIWQALLGVHSYPQKDVGLVRCGLFYHSQSSGNSSETGAKSFPFPTTPDQRWFAKVGEIFAPNDYGTITTGRYLGTHKLKERTPDPRLFVLEDDKVSSYRDDVSHRLDQSQPRPINTPHSVSRGTAHQPITFPVQSQRPIVLWLLSYVVSYHC